MLLQAPRGSEGVTPTIRNLGARRRWGVGLTRRLFIPPAKTLYPLYRRLGNPGVRSGRHGKFCHRRDSIPRPSSP